MAGQIALNKPSGGQLILSPEDGTSTETVTIPSVGVGKVLQVQTFSWNTEQTITSGSWTDICNYSITPISSNSKFVMTTSLKLRGYRQGGSDGRYQIRLVFDGSAYAAEAEVGAYDYGGSGIWLKDTYNLQTEIANTDTNLKQFSIQIGNQLAQNVMVNQSNALGYPTSSITVMEVAA